MTVLDPPRNADLVTADPPTARPERSRRSTASWRLAARLARRETRRRPGRTLLVMLLVAIPVIGMTVGSVVIRAKSAHDDLPAGLRFGRADLVVVHGAEQSADLARSVGDEGRIVTVLSAFSRIRGTAGDGLPEFAYAQITDAPMADPIFDGAFEFDAGRPPATATEVFLSRDIARRFAVEVGDRLVLDRPDISWTVTGIGRSADRYSDSFVILGELDRTLIVPDRRQLVSLVDLAPAVTVAEERSLLDELASAQLFGESRRIATALEGGAGTTAVDARELAWGWVGGVVALIVVGIVISAAFATSARRQLTTIGQLSANGASERVVRRTLGLQGSWTGLFGSAAGVAIGVGTTVAAWPLIEEMFNGRLPDRPLAPLDLIAIVATATLAATVAALVPARSAARVPVLTALAGRRPLSRPPRWMAPTGVGSFLVGLMLLVMVASGGDSSSDAAAIAVVLGSLLVLFGIACASPLIVHWVGTLGARAGGVVRLAARSLARTRTRSAAVITAVATVMAVAVGGLTAVGAERSASVVGEAPLDEVRLTFIADTFGHEPQPGSNGLTDLPPVEVEPLPADMRAELEAILPDAQWIEIPSISYDPAPFPADGPYPVLDGIVVATPGVLALLDLSDAESSQLETTGAVVLWPGQAVEIMIENDGGVRGVDLGTGPDSVVGAWQFVPESVSAVAVVTPEWAAAEGLDIVTRAWVVKNPTDLSDAQRRAAGVVMDSYSPWGLDSAFVSDRATGGATARPGDGESAAYWDVVWFSPVAQPPWVLIYGVVLAAALLMVLMVIAAGLSLAAAEGRSERDVLHAVGAGPAALRRLAAAKAWVITAGAAAVAIPVGYVVLLATSHAADRSAPFPWIAALALGAVVPLVAAGCAWASSGLAQRFRPITASSMSAD